MNNNIFFSFSVAAALAAAVSSGCISRPAADTGDIVIENDLARLVIGADATAKSLVSKETGEEMLDPREGRSVFSVTQDRPFMNEIKLVFPNCQTTYRADRVRREGDILVMGFEHVDYEAKVKVTAKDGYFIFELVGFDISKSALKHLYLSGAQVRSFRMLELPLRERENFGGWLNVVWDDEAAAAVVAAEPYTWIGSETRHGVRHLYADAHRDLKLEGARAALVVSTGGKFLDSMDAMERDLSLPLGVESRRSDDVNRSIYWTGDIDPSNVDMHIRQAKQGGFKMMLIYYTAVCKGAKNDPGYGGIADYETSAEYPRGYDSLREMLAKIKAAGITPGLHVLQTFIGLKTRYVTPEVDPRLNIKRRFTLERALGAADTEIHVQENPAGSPLRDKTRVLVFGGEAVSYEGFTTVRPYKFTGVRRGHYGTKVKPHVRGLIGGVLDVCEYGAMSCYIDQNSDLQDVIAEKIARIYDCGFEFMYNDGSEGVNVPQGIHVPNSQYRVWKKLAKKPRFMEGAAKGHFGWHLQSGANAFDVFKPEEFKKMIVRWPLYEAPIMRKDFTRVNFGWWGVFKPGKTSSRKPAGMTTGTQMDMWEFGTSRAAAWDCPVTVQVPGDLSGHPRIADLLEVMRRWEDVRERKWLTPEMKEALKSPTQEHHLYLNGKGEYELCEIEMLDTPDNAKEIRAFLFERAGRRVVACWHICGEAEVVIPFAQEPKMRISALRYIETDLSPREIRDAWKKLTFAAK